MLRSSSKIWWRSLKWQILEKWLSFSKWKSNIKETFVSQKKYAKESLKKFLMENYKVVSTLIFHKLKLCKDDDVEKVDETNFRSLVCCFMYLTVTRLDILHVWLGRIIGWYEKFFRLLFYIWFWSVLLDFKEAGYFGIVNCKSRVHSCYYNY